MTIPQQKTRIFANTRMYLSIFEHKSVTSDL